MGVNVTFYIWEKEKQIFLQIQITCFIAPFYRFRKKKIDSHHLFKINVKIFNDEHSQSAFK